MKEKPLTWRDVLDCKIWVGSLSNMHNLATKTGYSFFVWNDAIWQTRGGNAEQTSWRVADIS